MPEVAQTATTIAVVNRFNDALNQHDVQAVMNLMTDDCVFENTSPAPDGERFEGQAMVSQFWQEFFRTSPNAVFQSERLTAYADQCIVLWRYDWIDNVGKHGHVRGVDVLRVRDGKVAEKLAYVKG